MGLIKRVGYVLIVTLAWLAAFFSGAYAAELDSPFAPLVRLALLSIAAAFLGARLLGGVSPRATSLVLQFTAWLLALAIAFGTTLLVLWVLAQPQLWVADSETAKLATQSPPANLPQAQGGGLSVASFLVMLLLPVVAIFVFDRINSGRERSTSVEATR